MRREKGKPNPMPGCPIWPSMAASAIPAQIGCSPWSPLCTPNETVIMTSSRAMRAARSRMSCAAGAGRPVRILGLAVRLARQIVSERRPAARVALKIGCVVPVVAVQLTCQGEHQCCVGSRPHLHPAGVLDCIQIAADRRHIDDSGAIPGHFVELQRERREHSKTAFWRAGNWLCRDLPALNNGWSSAPPMEAVNCSSSFAPGAIPGR